MTARKAYTFSIIVALTALFVLVATKNAWLSDDAFITLRTVDNLGNGYGPCWNPGERVQSYTHPLWMFLLYGAHQITGEPFFTTLFVCIIVSCIAFALLIRNLSVGLWRTGLAATVLLFSKAFVDYSTSGLENPLSHLLLAVFFLLYLRRDIHLSKHLFWLALCAGLAMLNRMDTILLFAFPLLFATVMFIRNSERSTAVTVTRAALLLIAGFIPMVLWEAFSVLYYGVPFPNTAYAKLGTGIPRLALLEQGAQYFYTSLLMDPITLTTIAIAVFSTWARRDMKRVSIALGVGLYLAYVLMIGGGFMAGRFFTVPLFASAILLASGTTNRRVSQIAIVGLAVPGIVFQCILPANWWVDENAPHRASYTLRSGIADERVVYSPDMGLIDGRRLRRAPNHRWVHEGRAARAAVATDPVTTKEAIGFYGYYAGPTVHVVDTLALCDPLLARLPAQALYRKWRVGHYERDLPEGYMETLRRGNNCIANRELADFYDVLSLITRGPLLSPQRLRAIWRLNTGSLQCPFHLSIPGKDLTESLSEKRRIRRIEIKHIPAGSYEAKLSLTTLSPGESIRLDILFSRNGSLTRCAADSVSGPPTGTADRILTVPFGVREAESGPILLRVCAPRMATGRIDRLLISEK